jgi:hypothetical protein
MHTIAAPPHRKHTVLPLENPPVNAVWELIFYPFYLRRLINKSVTKKQRAL